MESISKKESQRIEFKRQLTNKFEQTVIAFLNSRDGGIIYFGVDDDSTIQGIENPDQVQLQIADRIKNNIRGETLGLYDLISETTGGKHIIKMIISSGTEKPYYLKEKGMTPEGCFIRNGSRIESMTASMIEKAYARRTRNSLSTIESPCQDLTFEQLFIFYQEHGKKLNDQFAKTLNFLTADDKFNLNAFLLSDNNDVTIKVAKFAGTNKIDLIENEEYGYCSIIKACKNVLDKLNIENKTFARIEYPFRQENKLIDSDSLREAVINAFVHNDYSDLMSPAFYLYSDRLEIVSYGGLIDGMSKDELVAGCSRPRNRELMRIFKDIELVEQLGSGMNRIMNVYKPDIFEISPNFFHIVFPFITENTSETTEKDACTTEKSVFTTDKTTEKDDFTTEKNSLTTEKLLKLIENDPNITTKQLALECGITDDGVYWNIKQLKKANKIKRVGGKKGGHWEIIVQN